ncbi:YdcH family protein [Sphingomonas sp. 3-13AW]|uniref:YdcH family protein n=1 Tax=Sphingomonas sp. 3-13AW TaxID=3050450 RepID=UPI003BB57CFC
MLFSISGQSEKEADMPQPGSPASLQARHSMIDSRIKEEQGRPLPDASAIAALKKQKLHIKDALRTG